MKNISYIALIAKKTIPVVQTDFYNSGFYVRASTINDLHSSEASAMPAKINLQLFQSFLNTNLQLV